MARAEILGRPWCSLSADDRKALILKRGKGTPTLKLWKVLLSYLDVYYRDQRFVEQRSTEYLQNCDLLPPHHPREFLLAEELAHAQGPLGASSEMSVRVESLISVLIRHIDLHIDFDKWVCE